jgi:hypothetical protein
VETKTSASADSLVELLPLHLRENFQKAERNIREAYGKSPCADDLLRVWIACATSWSIQAQFEQAVLDIKKTSVEPNAEGQFDEDSFDF